jgi:plasmid stabilization system protein ParE
MSTSCFARIQDNPRQFPIIDESVRRALARRFPYGVYFTLGESSAVVLAVLHLHRRPSAWKKRSGER